MTESQEKSSAHFDADALTAAQEAPILTVGGYLYRGRLLSIEEWLPWWEKLLALQAERSAAGERAGNFRRLEAFYRDYLRVVFPRRLYRWWAPDPVELLLRQPFAVVEEALASFFFLQLRATFGPDVKVTPRTIPSAQHGTSSPPATANAPGAK